MAYELVETFRVTAFSHFGKAMAKFESPIFPDDADIVALIVSNHAEYAEVKKIYTVKEV